MTPLPGLSVLKISGTDAGRFLQAQLTANLAARGADAAASDATFSAYCSAKGQVIATLLLAPHEAHWLAVVEASLLPVLVNKLRLYVLRDDVQLEPMAGHLVYGVEPQDSPPDGAVLLQPSPVSIQYAIAPAEPMASPEATALWRCKELLLGIPWLDLNSSEKYIPQMLGLDLIGAVSFSKGCYPGQEVIARARHLGQVKRRPQVLDLAGEGTPDTNSPCQLHTAAGAVDATLVHCVSRSAREHTVFAVAAILPTENIDALEQVGRQWQARRALHNQQ